MTVYDPRFIVANIDQDPSWLVDLEWYTPKESDEIAATLLTNQIDHLTNDLGYITPSPYIYKPFYTNNTSYLTNSLDYLTASVTLNTGSIDSYIVHRHDSEEDFDPSTLTILETLVAVGTPDTKMTHRDETNPIHNQNIYYKLESLFDF